MFLGQIFHVDEARVCRVIRRIAPLAELVLKIKPERLLSENDLKLLIVDATEQRIKRPKNQRDYYSGKKNTHTIKTEIVTNEKMKILQVSPPYEGALPVIPILADFGYQGLQNEHSAAVILPKKSLKTARYRLPSVPKTTNLLAAKLSSNALSLTSKKWSFLAARYRGHLEYYSQIFQTIAGIYNLFFDS